MPNNKADEYVEVKYYDGEPPQRLHKSKWFDIRVGLESLKPGTWRAFEIPSEHFVSARTSLRSTMRKLYQNDGTFLVDKTRERDGIIIIWASLKMEVESK